MSANDITTRNPTATIPDSAQDEYTNGCYYRGIPMNTRDTEIKPSSSSIAGDTQTGSRFARPEGYARRLGCSKRHVERLMKRGIVPFIKTGYRTVLIPMAEADEALLKLAVGNKTKGASAQ
ncbi:MAG: hypothetical protein LBV12_10025 [Puniceicoccales bacterium]|jgi:excisionase family DNA binding protein|nr:hypothetical protein [Puniceicoccales bacterium]